MTKLSIRKEALFVLHTLRQAGYEAYIVGGAIRDLLRNSHEIVKDYDFTTNATPEVVNMLFPESFYENQFGTVSITHQELLAQMGISSDNVFLTENDASHNRIIDLATATKIHASLQQNEHAANTSQSRFLPNFEITTYRSKEVYSDYRRPDPAHLQWGSSIFEDLERRDFTVNAMAIDISQTTLQKKLSEPDFLCLLNEDEYSLIDPYQGLTDLHQKRIRTVGDPHTRFQEDALRMLRAIRFAVQLSFSIDQATLDAIAANSQLLEHISLERIGDEFMKIMKSADPAHGVRLLDQTGLLGYIIPELLSAKGVEQGGHHTTDVWTHSIDALAESPSTDPIVRLATLLHDIGKPETYQVRDGEITFYNHEIVGSRMASTIAKRLRLSKHDIERIFTLVRHHMFYYQPSHTDAAVRRFMRRVGLSNIDDMLDLREADRLGSGARKTSWRLEEMKERMVQQLHQPMAVTDLAINGTDIMQELRVQPGPTIGHILQTLLEEVLENPEQNTRELLLERARQLVTA